MNIKKIIGCACIVCVAGIALTAQSRSIAVAFRDAVVGQKLQPMELGMDRSIDILASLKLSAHEVLTTVVAHPIATMCIALLLYIAYKLLRIPSLILGEKVLSQARVSWSKMPELEEDEVAKAYKVLTATGRSPWFTGQKWSLPQETADGNWIPGNWVEEKRYGRICLFSGITRALHISWDPSPWLKLYPKGQVYEVEIGDAFSLEHWKCEPSINFRVQKARLLRPVDVEELKSLHRPAYFAYFDAPLDIDITSGTPANWKWRKDMLRLRKIYNTA